MRFDEYLCVGIDSFHFMDCASTIDIIIGFVCVLLTLWTIKMQFFSKPKEELEHLRIQFKATQDLSLQIQGDLERLIAQYNAGKCKMVSVFTYETCLEEMKSSFKTNLTDEVLEKLVSQNPSKPTILSLIKSLEVQHENLMQLQVNLNLIRRQMDNP